MCVSQRHSTELEEASDALEFCETEIMNKRRELRTVHAQRTAFEGKLALELMYGLLFSKLCFFSSITSEMVA